MRCGWCERETGGPPAPGSPRCPEMTLDEKIKVIQMQGMGTYQCRGGWDALWMVRKGDRWTASTREPRRPEMTLDEKIKAIQMRGMGTYRCRGGWEALWMMEIGDGWTG